MNDWIAVGTGSLWIAGLAIICAALSYAHWRARHTGERLRKIVGIRSYQVILNLGAAMVGMSLFLTARSLWERVVWAVLTTVIAALGSSQWWAGWGEGRTRRR